MKKTITTVGIIAMTLIIGGCAQKAESIKATYVSPLGYQQLSCDELKEEVLRVNKRLYAISRQQSKVANKDALSIGAGALIFPPAILLMALGDDQKAEIGNLKGQYDTIKDVATDKNCSFVPAMR